MTVDREQILRDAEWLAQIQTGVAADRARLLGADLLALLTELEQAEKKHAQVSEWYNAEDRKSRELQARLEQAEIEMGRDHNKLNEQAQKLGQVEQALADLTPSPDGGYGPDNARTWKDAYIARMVEAREAEARLAKVPALVDDLRLIASGNWDDDSGDLAREIRDFASAALTAWEQE